MDSEPRGRSGDGEEAKEGTEGWDELVLDEDFIRGAQVSEPAARTRILRERWRRQPPEPQPWRADDHPAGWFFSKSRRRSRKRRRGKGD
jgi:hypothetical protein